MSKREKSKDSKGSQLNSDFTINTATCEPPAKSRKFSLIDGEPEKSRCQFCKQNINDPHLKKAPKIRNGVVERKALRQLGKRMNKPTLTDQVAEPEYTVYIREFCVYDDNYHLCNLDSNLIENGVKLFLSGIVYENPDQLDNDSSIADCDTDGNKDETNRVILCGDIGPIDEWAVTNNDAHSNVTLETESGFYKLTVPNPAYKSCYDPFVQKIKLTELVIKKCKENNATEYKELLKYLIKQDETYTEEFLCQSAEFLCNIMLSKEYEDDIGICDEPPYFTTPCIKTLVKMRDTPLSRDKVIESDLRDLRRENYEPKKPVLTPLIEQVFHQKIYHQHMSSSNKSSHSTYQMNCSKKRVRNDSDSSDCDGFSDISSPTSPLAMTRPSPEFLRPKWIGLPVRVTEQEDFYAGALVNLNKVMTGDCVETFEGKFARVVSLFQATQDDDSEEESVSKKTREVEKKPKTPRHKEKKKSKKWRKTRSSNRIKNINKEWKSESDYESEEKEDEQSDDEDQALSETESSNDTLTSEDGKRKIKSGPMKAHVQWLFQPNDTILGNKIQFGDSTLFLTNSCEFIDLSIIKKTACVDFVTENEIDTNNNHECLKAGCSQFYICSQIYFQFQARFEQLRPEFLKSETCCFCKPKREIQLFDELPDTVLCYSCYAEVTYEDVIYKVGDFVFLEPGCIPTPETPSEDISDCDNSELRDPEIYTEYYRKNKDKYFVQPTARPMEIAYIHKIIVKGSEVKLNVGLIFRPEDTNETVMKRCKYDLNYVYWTDSTYTVSIKHLIGPCHVLHKSHVPPPLTTWIKEGPNRFYFDKIYNTNTMKMTKIVSIDELTNYSRSDVSEYLPKDPLPPKTPLKCLDLFSGSGGLIEGLCQAGVAIPCWAVEIENSEATSYAGNFEDCFVIQDDCNEVLKSVLKGCTEHNGVNLPQKHEVDMIVAGPPCQGFSQLNRARELEKSKLKNGLIFTFLSFCDFFRPKFIILENVTGLIHFNKNEILQCIFHCLLKMNYQVTFDVLQSGNYGVAQSRNRVIILASKAGYKLPNFPKPLHAFNQLSVTVNGNLVANKFSHAPFRSITVRDAICDLPAIHQGSNCYHFYNTPMTHFQRKMKEGSRINGIHNNVLDLIQDHITKQLSPLMELRIELVPSYPNADWRDLPNICIPIPRNKSQFTEKLKYSNKRKVCDCNSVSSCTSKGQKNTVIPWSLAHTASRNNNWQGVLGRLAWDESFDTIVTTPNPMNKQGKILHPIQDRVLSVREYARAQGFPDSHVFRGNIPDMYKQIGNAVPPPLAKAIGYEIIKCLSNTFEIHVKSETVAVMSLRSSSNTPKK
uniref:Cytosine-specific methyltransferase n=1 Tax=Cacopsylla melanoneura TaxID=428564 RepID=A0A8D9EUQ9_9HEMI